MKRTIVTRKTLAVNDRTKSSSGFVYDTSLNSYLVPEYVKLSDDDAYTLFRGNEWVNAVVNRIVDDCTKLHPVIIPKKRDMELKPRHQRIIEGVDDFLTIPNPNKESFTDLREKFIKDMLVVGRGVMEKVFFARVLGELYALKASSVDVKADKHGTIPDKNAYVQKAPDGKEVWFDKNEIIWGIFRQMSGSYYGEKPLDTLANAVASDILRATYNSNYFVNGAEAGGIIALEGMGRTELEKFKQYYRDNHKGVSKAHRMLAVNVPIMIIRTAITNRDMEFSEYGRELKQKIYAVYHMQPFIMGDITSTTGKLNSTEQNQVYKDGALKPILQKEAEVYTKEILVNGFGVNDLVFAFEGIDLADTAKQSELDRADIEMGVLVINEVRRRRNLSPVPWGDRPINLLPGGSQVDPVTGELIPPREQGGGKEEKPPAKKPAKKSARKSIEIETDEEEED